jgi:predicted negative regulator of RcsB-dependent stress response
MVEVVAWLEVNRKRVLIGVIVLAVLISAFFVYRWNRGQAEIAANAALLALENQGDRGQAAKDPGAQAFLQVAASHQGTGAGAQARLLGAEALFKEGKYAEAKAQFEAFLRDDVDNPFLPTAALGIAASLDSQDKTNEALVAYQNVLAGYPNSIVAGQAKLAIARFHEARNEPAQALKIYDELARPNAPTGWSSEAGKRREDLLSRHPELVKTNEPLSTVTAPSLTGPGGVPVLSTNPPAANTPKP